MDRISIAAATESDLPGIAALAGVIWRSHYPDIISARQIEHMLAAGYAPDELKRQLASGIRFDHIVLDRQPIAFCAYGPADEPAAMKLHKLYIHPDHQRRGYGRRLVARCAAAAAAAGLIRLLLCVNKANHTAIAAYRALGFAVDRAIVVDIGGGFVMDDYVMAKAISAVGPGQRGDGIAADEPYHPA